MPGAIKKHNYVTLIEVSFPCLSCLVLRDLILEGEGTVVLVCISSYFLSVSRMATVLGL